MAAFEGLWPPAGGRRGTTIAGCVLTDAEIDHTNGLLQLREGCPFRIYSTATVHHWLSEYLPFESVLSDFADRSWTNLALNDQIELPLPDGQGSGLHVRAFEGGGEGPRFVPEGVGLLSESVVGLHIEDATSGGTLVYAPGVLTINESLTESARQADCVLMDGTFWQDDEPIRMGITDRTSLEMGHTPVDGPNGSLDWLAGLPTKHRAYIHVNNTNPMLNDRGPEQRRVLEHGAHVCCDGNEFE